MTSAHRIHHDLYRGSKVLTDPGDGGTITAIQDLQICEMVSTGADTRTLAAPTKPGIRLVLRHLTDGGSITITAAEGLNTLLETEVVMSEAGDLLQLIAVTLVADSTYRWEILVNTASVVSSATPSHTPSHTPSPSSTVSHTPSHTSSPSHTPSHTSSPSHTPSSTPSST